MWVHHRSMACVRVVDVAHGHQICRVAVNILNKELWTSDKGWSSSLGVGGTTPHHRKQGCYKMLFRPSDSGEFFGTT